MYRFFRKLNQNFIFKWDSSKYVKYAIGEILLVVIGILIALQINNWNEDRKQERLEISLLIEMKENLVSDLEDIRFNIKEDSETMSSNLLVLNHLENGYPYHDSLSNHFGKLQRASTLVANISAYENLKSLGFNIIVNDSLRRRITNLYSARYAYIQEVHMNTSNRLIWDHLNPVLLSIIKSNVVLEDAIPHDFDSLQENSSFKEVLRWHIAIKEFVIDLNKDTANEIREIVQLIVEEVERRS